MTTLQYLQLNGGRRVELRGDRAEDNNRDGWNFVINAFASGGSGIVMYTAYQCIFLGLLVASLSGRRLLNV